jgi:L-ribulose-5-phosphate 3-epimerase
MANPLAGHTNTYHSYGFDEALAGIAEAGYTHVELSAVPGWTEHVDLDADPADVRRKLGEHRLDPVSLSAHSDLTTAEGLGYGIKGVRWAADFGIPIVDTAVGGHQSADENETAFRHGRLRARPGDPARRRLHGPLLVELEFQGPGHRSAR